MGSDINSKKTVAEGRRISLSKACENPNCIEINDCCKHLKLNCAVEIDKAYPRDFMQVGRVRVQLKKEDGSLLNPAITSTCLLSRRAEPSKEASPKSASNSSNNSNSSKKKCFLVDCFGSGKTVAEGRVFSTNPKDLVHFVPLGSDASKVWVDKCKIGDARVWRPTSEFEIVADALGTTVA